MKNDWYQIAWEKTFNAATDEEADGMERAAIRAGVLWKCYRDTPEEEGCFFVNADTDSVCQNCGAKKE